MGDPRDFQSEFVAACHKAQLYTFGQGSTETDGVIQHPDDPKELLHGPLVSSGKRVPGTVEPGRSTLEMVEKYAGLAEHSTAQAEIEELWQDAVELDASAKASEIPHIVGVDLAKPGSEHVTHQSAADLAGLKSQDLREISKPLLSSATPLRELKPFRTGIVLTPKSEIPRTPNPVKAPTHDNFKSVQDALINELKRPKTEAEMQKWADGMTVAVGNVLSEEVRTKIDVIVTDSNCDENLHRGCYMQERSGHLVVFARSGSMSGSTAVYAPGEWTRAELR